jgi:xylulokinase
VRADDPQFIPYLAGERTPFMNSHLRGSWIGLSLATDRAAMLRSILEGVAQAVALGVEAVQASGERLPEIVPLIGGGTQHPDFRQLLADCCGVPLGVAESRDSAVVGAATLAAGVSINPHRIAVDGVVEPFPEAVSLLAERRAKMVAEATTGGTTA